MNRAEVLENAKACVCGPREQDYGSPEDNFNTIANLWFIWKLLIQQCHLRFILQLKMLL